MVAAPTGTTLRAGDDKQTGRWLLQQAREMIAQGRYDEAAQKVAEVKQMNIHWTLFDDTPARVDATIAKLRPKQVAAAAAMANAPQTKGDRTQAKVRLQQARAALASGQIDTAEGLANEVAAWNLRYGMLEDNPEKVLAAAHALRNRDQVRRAGPAAGVSQDIYAVLIQEARAAMAAGQLDVAEQKARRAQTMNVVPPLTADRAEAVLHDLAMARAQGTPATETASARAEREANDLLAAGNREAFAAKSVESQRLQQAAPPAGTSDPTVVQTQAPAPALTLTPAGADPAPAPAAAAAPSALGDPFPANMAAAPQPAPAPADATTPAPADAPAAVPTLTETPAPAEAPKPADAAPVLTDQPAASAPANPGETLLQQATSLMAAGNFDEARKRAQQAKAGGFGVEAKADDVLAQIALAGQGGAEALRGRPRRPAQVGLRPRPAPS